jgi:uncharacterized membrane protein YhhN
MGSRLFLHLYTVASMLEVYCQATGRSDLELFIKPLLMPLLLAWFWKSAVLHSKLERWTAAALVFSWGGDVFLMFGDLADTWFVAGLSSFLLGHLCYILAFRQGPFLPNPTTFGEQAPPRGLRLIPWVILPVLGLAGLLLWTIWHGLGEMVLPVAVYASVIAAMSLSALHRYQKVPQPSFGLVVAGALVFMLSDSIIAWNRFHQPFEASGPLIMVTYLSAQLLIAAGVLAQRSRMEDQQLMPLEPLLKSGLA